MNFKNIFLFLFAALFLSCEDNDTAMILDSDNLLIGNWIEPVYNNETQTYKRGNSLPNEANGISFKRNNEFIERTSGWCGTPPLSFFNIEGSFQLENTLISISTQNYYQPYYSWRIISLTEQELVLKWELGEQEIEFRSLLELFFEIQDLSYSVSCTNVSDWTFVGYGAKSCGGFQGYTPYSTKIDTVSFLQKVQIYTQAEKDFNLKWAIVSDCSISNVPISVICQYEYPELKY